MKLLELKNCYKHRLLATEKSIEVYHKRFESEEFINIELLHKKLLLEHQATHLRKFIQDLNLINDEEED